MHLQSETSASFVPKPEVGTNNQEAITKVSIADIWSQNATAPESVDACVHAFIKKSVWDYPTSQAVCSWDGTLTYKQLDELSSSLAHHLLDLGIKVGEYVILSLEKSLLAPVAILAVMKAGGVSIALDISFSQLENLRGLADFQDLLCLATPDNFPALKGTGLNNIVVLEHQLLLELSAKRRLSRLPVVDPRDSIFAAVDTASRGRNKLVNVTHSQFSSAIVYQQSTFGFTKETRTIDYLDYTSPVTWTYILHTLSCGGSICTPSPHGSNTAAVPPVSAFGNANCAFLTRDWANDFDYEGISTLIQVNYSDDHTLLSRLSPETQLSVFSTYGCVNLASLVPVSHTIIQGITNDQTFSEDSGILDGDASCVKTSPRVDSLDGSGNHDSTLRQSLPGVCLWIIDINDPILLAPFDAVGELCIEGPLVGEECTDEHLFVQNPRWLVGGSDEQPGRNGCLYRTGVLVKYDKYGTIRLFEEDPESQLDSLSDHLSEQSEARQSDSTSDAEISKLEEIHHGHLTRVESVMQKIWAVLLHVDPTIIHRESHFFSIGGKMREAVFFPRTARAYGISMNTRDIIKYPVLKDICEAHSSRQCTYTNETAKIVGFEISTPSAYSHIAQVCKVDESRVVDILPCTALQEGLLALTVKHPGDYIAKNMFKVGRGVDIAKLREAWDQVVVMNPILRTRIVSLPECGVVQAVLAEAAHWAEGHGNDETTMGLGTPLTKLSLYQENDEADVFLLWEIHHALYDGWSINLLIKDVEDVYYGHETQDLEPMDMFLQYITAIDETAKKEFWRKQFSGIQGTHFPTPKVAKSPEPDQRLEISVSKLQWINNDYTPSTILRAAWSIVAAHMLNTNESTFDVTVTGRHAPVPGIERMAGPTIATVPLRVVIDWDENTEFLLRSVQRQSVDMIPFEQTGLQHIRRFSEEASTACGFQALLVVQPAANDSAGESQEEFLAEVHDEAYSTKWQDFSTFALVIECQLESSGVQMRLGFDSTVVSQSKMMHIAQNLSAVIRGLSQAQLKKQTLRNLVAETITPFGLDQIWAWNKTVPGATELCVHDLIAQRVQENPTATAICAWDGELTYGQLAELSDSLANRLVGTNVRGLFIPLYFEKSMWMPVAALAVMKAGAAAVAVDMKLPEDRIRSLVSQIVSPVVLSSVENLDLARRLAGDAEVILVGSPQDNSKPLTTSSCLPRVHPSDTLYAVFTSGSTGAPKGVMVSHRNFCSAITYQQQLLQFSTSSRVLDFSSYAFDAAWCNLIHALTCGGCLCIPSAFERENQLSDSFSKYQVTSVDLTPSVARMLGPSVLSDLTTLILGGEAVVPADAYLAGDRTTIINVYGPAECTPTVTVSEVSSSGITIGRGTGVCTWVVGVDNPDLLAPLGEVGELCVEGPLVGQGYLGNLEKTAAAFIQDPTWLLRGGPGYTGRTGRVYRTGDLVRYTESGELLFVGRKDTQVKIRGQRVELEDIEHQIANCMNSIKGDGISALNVVAETILPREATNSVLVAFVTLECSNIELTDELHKKMVQDLASMSSDRLQERLPVYMIPTSYIPVRKIPITQTGKTDRRQLREIGESAWKKYRTMKETEASEEALSEAEIVLQQIWMSVLNLSMEETSVNKAFTRIGGDSISAMQVVAHCRQHSIAITVADILQSGTIRKLASLCKSTSRHAILDDDEPVDEDTTEPFHLSPIQQLFFDAYPSGLNHFNQTFVLELGSFVPTDKFFAAIQDLVERHAILRNRFHRPVEGEMWMQSIAPSGPASFAFQVHNVLTRDEVVVASQWRQENLDIENGPVFACDLFNVAGDVQLVTLSAHHLVIDLVSWRIIWGDIEDHVKHGKLIPPPSTSWKSWLRRQMKANRHTSPLQVLPYSLPLPELEFWELPLSENTFSNCTLFTEAFEPPVTNAIFADANECLRTEPIDILLGAMAHSFHQVFPERSVPVIWIEGHGREHSDDLPVDVSGTVGWFTTIHPVPVFVKPGDSVIQAIRLAKDTRRKVPGKGQPYFACRYYSESGREAAKGQDVTEITFNFTGRFQQLEAEEGLFKRPEHLGGGDKDVIDISQQAHRLTMIEINADVEEDWLLVTFQVHQNMKHQERLQKWARVFGRSIQDAVTELSKSAAGLTLSDLPLLPMSYGALDTLLRDHLPGLGLRTSNIVEILPCSPLQEGILLSSEKQAASYATCSTWRCIPTDGVTSRIESRKLQIAWSALVQRHSILSTVFALHPEGDGFIQIVLGSPNATAKFIHSGAESPEMTLNNLVKPTFAAHEPQHSFVVCESDNGDVASRLDISHALIDAASMTVIVQDLISLYDDVMPAAVPPFGDMMRHICSIPRSKRIAPWAAMLDGVKPCEFPLSTQGVTINDESHIDMSVPPLPLEAVSKLCKDLGITRAVFFQVAWAMVLAHFTGMDEVCFGYLASGRDAPLDGIEGMVGPLANLLISRINLRDSARRILKSVSDRSIQHLAMQHASLAEIQHKLRISDTRLFNTSLSIRESDKFRSLEKRSLSFEPSAGEDPHEFDISLSANIDGDKIDLVVEYREPYIHHHIASQACDVLSAAVAYLVEANYDVTESLNTGDNGLPLAPSYSLFNGFYTRMVGTGETTTTAFWRDQFHGTTGTHFPSQPAAVGRGREYQELALFQKRGAHVEGIIPSSTYIKAAWAILVAKILDSTEVILGARIREGILLPVRIPIQSDENVRTFLQLIQHQEQSLERFKHTGLQRIRRISRDSKTACSFQTIISVNNDDTGQEEPSDYGILFKYNNSQAGSHVRLTFDSNILSEKEVTRLFYQFEHIHQQLLSPTSEALKLQQLSVTSTKDLQDIWAWNAKVPEAVSDTIPHMILQTVCQQPSVTAIHAWDGSLTYQQLDDLSAGLAYQLRVAGVQQGDVIPLCFEKSMWMPVAAMAVMKAGGACVATDPSTQPEERLRALVAQVEATTILSSATNAELSQGLGAKHVITVDMEHICEFLLSMDHHPCLPPVLPSDVLYIIFTSGTTGIPKGAMVTHGNFCSAIVHQRDLLGFESNSRVLDFSSYAFDVAWSNLLNTLTAGGCLCIPSAEERQDSIAACLDKYKITVSDFTPSVLRNLEPQAALAQLSTMLLGGEVVLPSDAQYVREDALVVSAYGPAECTPTSMILHLTPDGGGGLGKAWGLCTWVVDTDDPDRLAPIGTVGELWLEGPLIGAGYINNPEKTKESFFDDPGWLLKGIPGQVAGRQGRVYRTGDLVQYQEDGTLLFKGRKDTQVKIRGQRIELEEVEHYVQLAIAATEPDKLVTVVAETIKPQGTQRNMLVAFVCLGGEKGMVDEEHDLAVRAATSGVMEKLKDVLPPFMIPNVFIPIRSIPMTATGKTDRRQLRNYGSSLTSTDIAALSRSERERRAPTNDSEKLMQGLWAEVLNMEPASISIDDSFFRIGGDSIGAMKLVGLARRIGLSLAVRDVFQRPIMRDLCALPLLG